MVCGFPYSLIKVHMVCENKVSMLHTMYAWVCGTCTLYKPILGCIFIFALRLCAQELSEMSMSDLVAQRLQAQRQILINPANILAHQTLNQIEQQVLLVWGHTSTLRTHL